jgi:DNA-directed RNA polymerase specialized sigma24 family protein
MRDAAEVEELMGRLEPLARTLALRYYWPGSEPRDVAQVARIGLWRAIMAWDGERELEPFARVVATRLVVNEVRNGSRLARAGDRAAASLDARMLPDGATLAETLPAPGSLAELVEWRMELRSVLAAHAHASELEREALGRSLRGEPYAANVEGGNRSWDNACQRARRRIRAALSDDVAA